MPLVVFEGIDGCGKSTQMAKLCRRLEEQGKTYRTWREPGSTALGEQVRAILLDPTTQAAPVAELFGYLMARAQLVSQEIAPALDRNELIILDRFYYSTLAYQAYGLGLNPEQVAAANALALQGTTVDRVFWLRIDPAEAEARRAGTQSDRIEMRGLNYLSKVDKGYGIQAQSDKTFHVLDGQKNPDELHAEIWTDMQQILS